MILILLFRIRIYFKRFHSLCQGNLAFGGSVKAKSIGRKEYKLLIKGLIEARKAAQISQQELAQKLGWSQAEVSKYEHFVRRIDAIELVDICQAIGVDYKHLISKAFKG